MVVDVGVVAQWITSLGIVGGFFLAVYKLIKKFSDRVEKTEESNAAIMTELRTIRENQDRSMGEIKGEMSVMVDCFAAVFDGLEQLNCNGAVTDAKNKLNQRLNEQAHQ